MDDRNLNKINNLFDVTGNFWLDVLIICIIPWLTIGFAFKKRFDLNFKKFAFILLIALILTNIHFFSNDEYEEKYNKLNAKYEKSQDKINELKSKDKKNKKIIEVKTTNKITSTPNPTKKPTKKPKKTEPKIKYDSSITFDQLNRNPDAYTGKGVIFTGEIIQVMTDSEGDTYRIDVGPGIMLCNYKYKKDELRLIENDRIRFKGVSLGLYTYETVLGAEQTVPWVYIDQIVSR